MRRLLLLIAVLIVLDGIGGRLYAEHKVISGTTPGRSGGGFTYATQTLSASDQIDCSLGTTIGIVGDGGPVNLTANPQIKPGIAGQECTLLGTSGTDTVTLDDGTGFLFPQSTCVISDTSHAVIRYNAATSTWIAVAGSCFSTNPSSTVADTFCIDTDGTNYCIDVESTGTKFRFEDNSNNLVNIEAAGLSIVGDGTTGSQFEIGGGDATTEPGSLAINQGADGGTEKWGIFFSAGGEPRFVYDSDGTLSKPTDSSGAKLVRDAQSGSYTINLADNSTIPQDNTPNAAGEIGVDTTANQLLWYGTSLIVSPANGKTRFCFKDESPNTANDNKFAWFAPGPITVTNAGCSCDGGTASIQVGDGTNMFEAITCANGSWQADDGSITNATFTTNERIEYDTISVTGCTQWIYCIDFTWNRQ